MKGGFITAFFIYANVCFWTVVWNYIIGYYSQAEPHDHDHGPAPNEAEKQFRTGPQSVATFT